MGVRHEGEERAPRLPGASPNSALPQLRWWRDATFLTPPGASGEVGGSLNRWARTPGGATVLPAPCPLFPRGRGEAGAPPRGRVGAQSPKRRSLGERGWRGLGVPQSPEAEPSFLPSRHWHQKPSPKAELEPSRQGAPPAPFPAGAPLTPGPATLTARLPLPALRATGASPGALLLGWARGRGTGSGRCPRGHGQLACARSCSRSGPPPRPGGRWLRRRRRRLLGLLPRPRAGAGVGREVGGEAGASWRGERSHGRSGDDIPPARRPRLARPGTPGCQCLGAPNVRGRDPRVRTFQARTPRIGTPLVRTRPRPASPEPLAPPSCPHCALRAADAGSEGWGRPGPARP